MKKSLVYTLKILFGATLLFYVLRYKFNFSMFSEIKINLVFIALLMVNSLIITFFRTLKWGEIISRFFSKRYGFKKNWSVTLIGQFFAFFTPSRLGDFVKIRYIKKELGYKKSLAAAVIDRVFDVFVILFMAGIGLIYWKKAIEFSFNSLIVLILLFLVAAATLVFVKSCPRYVKILSRFIKTKMKKKPAAEILLLTFIVWVLTYAQFYLASLSLNTAPNIVGLFALISIYTVGIMLPISINGIGVRESLSFLLFPLLGIKGEIGIIIAWLVMAANSIFPALIGYIYFVRTKPVK